MLGMRYVWRGLPLRAVGVGPRRRECGPAVDSAHDTAGRPFSQTARPLYHATNPRKCSTGAAHTAPFALSPSGRIRSLLLLLW